MPAAWTFGLAGLIPFVGLALLSGLGPQPWQPVAAILLAQYGALITAFVGALHWGRAAQAGTAGAAAWLDYGYSVLPALWAWFALQFPVHHALQLLAAGLVACLAADLVFQRRRPWPAWLIRLRLVLTAAAVTALLAAAP
jgi:hypothetical protein